MTMHNVLTDVRFTASETGFTGNSPKGQRAWVPVQRWSEPGKTLAANLGTCSRVGVHFESFELSDNGKMVFVRDVRELELYSFNPITMIETGDVLRIPVQVPITERTITGIDPVKPEGLTLGRIASMVATARQEGAKRINLRVMGGTLSLTGENSRQRPGTLAVNRDGYGTDFYGFVEPNGFWQPLSRTPAEVITEIRALDADPAAYAKRYAKLTATWKDGEKVEEGSCCFCNLTLTDKRSTSKGYGPICAGKYNLPWGSEGKRAKASRITATEVRESRARKIDNPFAWPRLLQPLVKDIKKWMAPDSELGIEAGTQGVSFHSIDKCESCGTDCDGVNLGPWYALPGKTQKWHAQLAQQAHDAGEAIMERHPELGACDALSGSAVCPNCWIEDEDEEGVS